MLPLGEIGASEELESNHQIAADCKSFNPVIPPCRPSFRFLNVALSAASASYKYDGPDVVTSLQIMWDLSIEPDAFVCLQP